MRPFRLLAAVWLPLALLCAMAAAHAPLHRNAAAPGQAEPGQAPPTPEEIEALRVRALKNIHQSDELLGQYERTEHDRVRGMGKGIGNKDVISRIIPTGAGEARVELERDGKPNDLAVREQQWHRVAQELEANSHRNDPAVRREFERAARRQRERSEMVDAAGKAFRFQFVGREVKDGHTLLEARFEPDPAFRSSVRYAMVLKHIHGTLWVDEASGEIVRLNAELFEEVNIVGGLVVKVYRGSHMSLEQSEVQPGVWMPTHISYDLEGRLLLFPASYHELIDDSAYQHIGLPEEALAQILRDHPEHPARNASDP